MEYSKREIAEICGVTTQALDKKLRKTGLIAQCRKVSNRLLIPETVATKLTTIYRVRLKPDETVATKLTTDNETVATKLTTDNETVATKLTTDDTANGSAVEALNRQLEVLQRQLEVKDRQIADLSSALVAAQDTAKAAQALHAADVQKSALESGDQKQRRWPWAKKNR